MRAITVLNALRLGLAVGAGAFAYGAANKYGPGIADAAQSRFGPYLMPLFGDAEDVAPEPSGRKPPGGGGRTGAPPSSPDPPPNIVVHWDQQYTHEGPGRPQGYQRLSKPIPRAARQGSVAVFNRKLPQGTVVPFTDSATGRRYLAWRVHHSVTVKPDGTRVPGSYPWAVSVGGDGR